MPLQKTGLQKLSGVAFGMPPIESREKPTSAPIGRLIERK